MLNSHHLGPGIPCESIQAIANRCFTGRCMCIDASAGVSSSKPVIYAMISDGCHRKRRFLIQQPVRSIGQEQWMNYEWLRYSSALYKGMQNLPLNKKSYSSSLLAIFKKPAPSCSPSRGREIRWGCINNSTWEEKNQMNIKDTMRQCCCCCCHTAGRAICSVCIRGGVPQLRSAAAARGRWKHRCRIPAAPRLKQLLGGSFYGNVHFSVPGLAFTEILHLKNTLGLQFLYILKWNNMLFEQLHLLDSAIMKNTIVIL